MSDSCDPMDCSLPGFSAHRIFRARILEWVAVSFPRGSSQPTSPVLAGGFFVASFNILCYRGQRERESVCVCVCVWLGMGAEDERQKRGGAWRACGA